MNNRTLLAIAAAFNGTALPADIVESGGDIRTLVVGQMEDFFRTEFATSSQFDRATVLREVQEVSDDDLLSLLTQIGYRATPSCPDMFTPDPTLWAKFIEDHNQ